MRRNVTLTWVRDDILSLRSCGTVCTTSDTMQTVHPDISSSFPFYLDKIRLHLSYLLLIACLTVHRAHSLYTIPATGSNEYRSNALVNLLTSTSRNTPVEYDIFDPSEEDVPSTPSISVSQLATGPGSKSSWRIGMVVVGVLLAFIVLTVIILTIYFVKR